MPDKEERIVARRLEEFEANMRHARGNQEPRRAGVVTLRVGVVATPYGEHGIDFVQQAERLGVDSVWVPEFWAGDALIAASRRERRTSDWRPESCSSGAHSRDAAMSALSMRRAFGWKVRPGHRNERTASHGGWHGVRSTSPCWCTREMIDIIRAITAGNASSTTVRSMVSFRCPTAKAAASVRSCRQRTYRSTSQRSARTIFGSR